MLNKMESLVCLFFMVMVSGSILGQKGNNTKQDQRRENERVAKAERDLADSADSNRPKKN